MERKSAEELMELYERLKPYGYLVETREAPAKVVVYRHWSCLGFTQSFEEGVLLAAADYEEQMKDEED